MQIFLLTLHPDGATRAIMPTPLEVHQTLTEDKSTGLSMTYGLHLILNQCFCSLRTPLSTVSSTEAGKLIWALSGKRGSQSFIRK